MGGGRSSSRQRLSTSVAVDTPARRTHTSGSLRADHGRGEQWYGDGESRARPREGDVDGIPAIRPDRSARIRHRVRLLGNQRHLWPDRRNALHPRGPSRDRQRHQLFRHRRSLRHGRLGARTGQGARRAAEGRHGRHQGRRRLSGRAQPPRQHAPAPDGRPRQQPAQSRHRSCRRLSGALAGHQHALRGDHADPRRRRPSGQGTLRRRVEFPPVAAGSLHEAAAHRRRAVRLEHVRPPDASGRSSRGVRPTTSG